MRLRIHCTVPETVKAKLNADVPDTVKGTLCVSVAGDGRPYEGEYDVIPSAHTSIILPTKKRVLSDDVIVRKIYAAEVSNPAGGNTYYIASGMDE